MDNSHYNPDVPEHIPADRVHDFNLYNPCRDGLDVFESINRLHELGLPDVFWTRENGGHWVALSAEAISDALRDPVRFSSNRQWVPEEHNFDAPFAPLTSDPPDHARYRAVLAPIFAPAKINQLEARVRKTMTSLIDDLVPRGKCEFMGDFALLAPIAMFLELVDLPAADRPELVSIVAKMIGAPPPGERRDYGLQAMQDYCRPIVEERTQNPGDDLISKIVTGKIAHSGVSRDLTLEEKLQFTAAIVAGGLDSIGAALGFCIAYLAKSPDARKRLIDDPKIVGAAIDEMMRRFPGSSFGRRLMEDMDFHGASLRKGDHIVWQIAMHNYDKRKFPRPMEVDFDRQRIPNASFGIGNHFCLGSPLARLELRVFVEEWLSRIPDFWIPEGADLPIRTGITMSYLNVPLEWRV